MILHRLSSVPPALLSASPGALAGLLGGPTLIRLEGRRHPPLFVSVLLHGNEPSGLEAVQLLLREAAGRPLPRAMIILIGNVEAAARQVRSLAHQPDYNRIWQGCDLPEGRLAAGLLAELRSEGIFASVDVHNNTGLNPHYACVANLEARHLWLASQFNHFGVLSAHPDTTLTANAAAFAPAVTIECGQVGDPRGGRLAYEFIQSLLHLSEIPPHAPRPQDFTVFRAVTRLCLRPGIDFRFAAGAGDAPVCLRQDLDRLNFSQLPVGTVLGWTSDGSALLHTEWESDAKAGGPYVTVDADTLRVCRPFYPAMLTTRPEAVAADCLGYVMEPVAADLWSTPAMNPKR